MTPSELKRMRKRLRFTQDELAKELGVTRMTVTKWEAGVHQIPAMAVKLLERIVRERRPPERLR